MPTLFNDIWSVTVEELIPNFYNTEATLRSEISRYQERPYGIKKVCSGGNGRKLLIAFDSLEPAIKEAIGDPRKPAHFMERFYKVDAGAVRFYQQFRFEDGGHLSLSHQEEYITNASVLIACIALKEARERERKLKGISCKGVMKTLCDDATGFNATLKTKYQVEHTLPSSEKRFKMAFNEFSKTANGLPFDFTSLISGKLRNQNSRKVTDPVMRLLNDLFAGQGNKPNRTEVANQYEAFLGGYIEVVSQETGEVYNPSEFKTLSEATIINYLGSWTERIGSYAKRSGDRQKLMQQFKPHHSLKRPEFAGSIISIDDRQPPFEYAPGQRVWFYNGIDLGSEVFTCWVYGKSKEGIIMEFYRQLVRNYTEWGFNLPLELEAESSLNSSFTDTFLRPGTMFDHVRIEANNARGKRIERYFRDLRYGSEKQREGWLARPFAMSESNQAGGGKKVITPFGDIVENSLRDIQEWNNAPHSVHKNKTRWEIFCERQHPELKPTNWKSILPHLGYETKSSVNVGHIRLQNKEFLLGDDGAICLGEKLITLMRRIEGEEVTVYWLDDNKGDVLKAVIYLNDTCICEAIAKPVYSRAMAERTPKDEQARETMSAYVATIEGYMRTKRNAINDVLVINNRTTTTSSSGKMFVMPGLAPRYEVTETSAEIMDTEFINESDDFAFIPQQQNRSSFIKSTKDRI